MMGKISTLPADSAPSSDDYIVVNDATSGQTKKVLLSDLFSQGLIGSSGLSDQAVTTAKTSPTYMQSTTNHNGTGTRQSSGSNYTVTGTSIAYTTGDTDEIIEVWGFALLSSTNPGFGIRIQANGSNIGRRTYTDTTAWACHYPHVLFEASANTLYTFTLQVIAAGTVTITNANTDPANNYEPSLELIAWGRT